ncbi:Alpha/Beta hydrolase protein [Mycena latifolia]|nr:Alpha/Beta hydrolase protein [Mycena latifolia]
MRFQHHYQNAAIRGAMMLACLVLTAQARDAIVDLGYAKYQGSVDTSANITTFLGIRYAAPPTGDLRFRAPESPHPVPGVLQATVQPDQCYQASQGTAPTNPLRTRAASTVSSEDCLFLSVSYPSDAEGVPEGPLPVLVYIHGGGYLFGSSSQYRGTDLLSQSNRGLVVVIIQYRLGVFGFLPGEEVKKHGSLNAGLLDQEFALRWVHHHIHKFGGDPEKVTIWGESAGAGSVVQHVVANNGQTKPQLFRAAITSSTFMPSQYHYNDRIPELLYSEFVTQTNCSKAACSMTCLRAVNASVLETANFITQRPTLALAEGKINGKALLAVTNSFEGNRFVNQSTGATANATKYALELFPDFEPAPADRVGELYRGLGTPLVQTNAVQGESIFVCPTYYLLRAFAGSAFKGEFALPPATHGFDVLYYFPSYLIDNPAAGISLFNSTDFRNAFAQAFTAFAISLDPNVKLGDTITPVWEKWDVGHTEMVFNKTEDDLPIVAPVTTSSALLERCEFWNSVGNLTGQ